MLEREESSRLDTPNPLYVPLKGLDGRVFFYQPGTTEILREQSVVSLPCGGVLCEELGMSIYSLNLVHCSADGKFRDW